MGKDYKSYLKGVGTSYLGFVITSVVNFALTPFIVRSLTKEEYGVFAIVEDMIAMLALLQLGTVSVFNSMSSQLIGKKDYRELNRYAATTLYSQIVIALVIVLVGAFLAYNVNDFFNIETENRSFVFFSLFLFVIAFGLDVIGQTFTAVFIGNKQIDLVNYFEISKFFFYALSVFILLKIQLSLFGLAISQIATAIVGILILWFFLKRMPIPISFNYKYFSKKLLKGILNTGVWFTIGGIAGILISSIDRALIGKLVALSVVANYTISKKLFDLVKVLFGKFVNTSRPFLGQLYGANDMKRLSDYYMLLFETSFIFIVVGVSGVMVINEWFIGWWVGNDFYLGTEVNFLIALNLIIQSAVLPNRALLATTLYQFKAQNSIRFLEGGMKAVLAFWLAKNYGIQGILWASIISSVLMSNVLLNLMSFNLFKKHGLKISQYRVFVFLVLPVTVYFMQHVNIWLQLVVVTIESIIFTFLYYQFFLSLTQKQLVVSKVRPLLNKVGLDKGLQN